VFSTVKLHLPASVEGEPNIRKEMSSVGDSTPARGWIRVARLRVEGQLGRYNEQEEEDRGVGWCPLPLNRLCIRFRPIDGFLHPPD
jgi:hypothetical protein